MIHNREVIPTVPLDAVLAHMIMSNNSDNKDSIKKDWDPGSGGGGTGTPLFTAEELDIYCNKVTLEAFIFHGKKVDYDKIDRLEYDPKDHSVDVVRKDGSRQDLGVKIQWLVRPYFTKAEEISIVQTKDGESIDGIVVPLVHKGQ